MRKLVRCVRQTDRLADTKKKWLGAQRYGGVKRRGKETRIFLFAQVDMRNNVTLLWDGEKIGVDVPTAFKAVYPDYKMFGLLGAYNNNTIDDFMGPDGVVRNSTNDFGNSWLVPDSCPAPRNHTAGKTKLQVFCSRNAGSFFSSSFCRSF